jgi:hypothetical protein
VHADNDRIAVEFGIVAQAGRDQNAPLAVEIEIGGVGVLGNPVRARA